MATNFLFNLVRFSQFKVVERDRQWGLWITQAQKLTQGLWISKRRRFGRLWAKHIDCGPRYPNLHFGRWGWGPPANLN
ncbi:unnamed protein product [Prunus armeniaca]|uniref:Uncharacterized protein n=1 Tax=Prunus armeniaca TaxID=36596 RepID=A0A6J5X416_PRUAR|nr:unnamed protein product [Prunus armeniaca]CAB4308766.1 unnamed protein product [Prunus armeniaca]